MKYSIVTFEIENGEKIIGYVQDVYSGMLKISNYPKLVEATKVKPVEITDIPTKELQEVMKKLEFLKNVYKVELRRRAYDIEKNKIFSKYFNDEL